MPNGRPDPNCKWCKGTGKVTLARFLADCECCAPGEEGGGGGGGGDDAFRELLEQLRSLGPPGPAASGATGPPN